MYVVFGVTGNTGKVVADTLLSQKLPVRVVVRDAAKGAAWKAKGAEVAVASVDDAVAVEAAMKGATGAYVLLPPDYASTTNIADKVRQVDALVRAIPASGVRHVVLLSSIGAQHADGTGPIKSLFDAEKRLGALGVPTTFLRAPYFMENWASVLAPAKAEGKLYATFEKRIPMIATKDIGAAAAGLLVEGGTGVQVVHLHGPAEYAPSDVAATLARLLSRDVTPVLIPREHRVGALSAAGLTADLAELFAEMGTGIDEGLVAFDAGARDVRGATTLEEVLRGLLAV